MNKSAAILLILFSAALGFGTGASANVGSAEANVEPLAGAAHESQVRDEPAPLATCGDHSCDAPEDCNSCPSDCGGCCGNGRCEPPEDCNSCSEDCGSCCGNGRCEPPEDSNSCPSDC